MPSRKYYARSTVWRARVHHQGKSIHLGCFKTYEEALEVENGYWQIYAPTKPRRLAVSYFNDVAQFHIAFRLPVGYKPLLPTDEEQALRLRLVTEEYHELVDAHQEGDIVEIADAIADQIYVLCGMAVAYGIPLDAVWNEVHRSNMAKIGPDGYLRFRADGKVLKPEGWTPPDIEGIIINHAR
jgi:predicted HAD superfamily Cof-like phosphohydrolase